MFLFLFEWFSDDVSVGGEHQGSLGVLGSDFFHES